jgi:hypothetical protein
LMCNEQSDPMLDDHETGELTPDQEQHADLHPECQVPFLGQ